MSEGMLQRASSNRKKDRKSILYSVNDLPDEEMDNPTDDKPSGEYQSEEKIVN